MLYFKHKLNPDCISTARQTVAVSVHKNNFTHEQGYIHQYQHTHDMVHVPAYDEK